MGKTAGTLLVVDDDSDCRSLYHLWLTEHYEIRTAVDGVSAIEQMDETIDAVVIDREMPRKDGVEVTQELRASEFDPAVVMISGVEPDVDLLEIPVDDYLQKPVERAPVVEAVTRAQTLSERPDELRRHLALERRAQIVEENGDPSTLADSGAYQRARSRLDHAERASAQSHQHADVPAEGTAHNRRATPLTESQ